MLHPQFDKDCVYLGKLDLCHLLLMNDKQYLWCIPVPQLRIHHIVCLRIDKAWPGGIWRKRPTIACEIKKHDGLIQKIQDYFADKVIC